jgi:hypothetical protein
LRLCRKKTGERRAEPLRNAHFTYRAAGGRGAKKNRQIRMTSCKEGQEDKVKDLVKSSGSTMRMLQFRPPSLVLPKCETEFLWC